MLKAPEIFTQLFLNIKCDKCHKLFLLDSTSKAVVNDGCICPYCKTSFNRHETLIGILKFHIDQLK